MWLKIRSIAFTISILLVMFGNVLLIIEDDATVKAQTIIVDNNGFGNYTTIQAAINAADSGDTIRIWDGSYNESLAINKKINLIGNGTNKTKIIGTNPGDVIYVTANGVLISNFQITGNNSDYQDSCIRLDYTSNCLVIDNYCHSYYNGISLDHATYNEIISNNCTNNTVGISSHSSDSNEIINNNCSNNRYGLSSIYSDHVLLLNNSFISNIVSGISISSSKFNKLSNNLMSGSGFGISGSSVEDWNTHTIFKNNTFNNRPIYYWSDRSFGIVPTGAGQVFINNCSKITIKDQKFSLASSFINLAYSTKIVIKDNRLSSNSIYGHAVYIHESNNNFIHNNQLTNFSNSIYLINSDNNKITNNSCLSNNYGINLLESNECDIFNNTCTLNEIGMDINIRSTNNYVMNNNCSGNNVTGIRCYHSNNNIVKSNKCNSNIGTGIGLISRCQLSILVNNTCDNNSIGIQIQESTWNDILRNKLANNTYGNYIETNSYQNKFEENNISLSKNTGFYIDSDCNHNTIFHNNFINNTKESFDQNLENNWYSSEEGNYWSDYTGKDNGLGDGRRFDGIGDTNLSHNKDYYPFMNRSGWEYPGIPVLRCSAYVSNDGYYSISWYNVSRSTGYVVEEDVNASFNSPVIITDGWEIQDNKYLLYFNKSSFGTFFYRVRAFNDKNLGDWSNQVNISMSLIPSIPSNFKISVYPEGNAINLTWSPNVKWTDTYVIQSASTGMWDYLVNLSHPTHHFNHSGLINGIKYFYRVCAENNYGQCSPFSKTLSAIPADSIPPHVPIGLSAIARSDHEINLSWNQSHAEDLAGYEIYIKPGLSFGFETQFELIETVPATNTSIHFSGLTEQVTYQFKIRAFDEVPNYSEFSVIINATPIDLTHPEKPIGLEIIASTHDSLTLHWEPNTESDVVGYNIYRSGSSSGLYKIINLQPVEGIKFVATGLNETTKYYFKIKAVDDAGLLSLFSDHTSGITNSKPRPPEIIRPGKVIEILEDNINREEINLSEYFNDPNDDTLEFRAEGQENITVYIYQNNGSVILSPKKNWNGNETLSFFASDGTFERAINFTIHVVSVNDPPKVPKIIDPESGIEIEEGESLDFLGECDDADLVYGDRLEFFWYSNIQGKLGEGEELTGIKFEPGQHLITLEVFDQFFESENTTIYISVKDSPEDSKDDEEIDPVYGYIANAIITIFIVVIIIFLARNFYVKKIRTRSGIKDGPINEDDLINDEE